MIINSKVPTNYRNLSILDYLSKRFTYLSRDEWTVRIGEGRLSINDVVSSKDQILKENDVVTYDMPDFKEPEADLNYTIVYEDDWILGINKPGNLLVHHKGHSFKSNLIYQLRYVHEPKFEEADIINRLDRETSGLVLVSKNKEALKKFTLLFSNRAIKKEYLALVHGELSLEKGIINEPIGKDPDSKIKSKQRINGLKAKEAYTEFELVEKYGKYSLVKLFPKTGRTHQLRVHLQSIGFPIVGDKFYSVDEDTFFKYVKKTDKHDEIFGMKRQALHCSKLSFIHPFTNKPCEIEASMPDDMADLI